MKKFLIVLLVLIILGGVVFFAGWAQIAVPPGACGVLHSKTHGVDPQLVQSGEFRWVWYKLIPTNVTVKIFRLKPVQRTINAAGSLPSGEVYSAFAGNEMDFSWQFNASFSFSVNQQNLVDIVSKNGIDNQEDFEKYEQNLAGGIEAFILKNLVSGENTSDLEAFMTGFSEKIETSVMKNFPVIRDFSCLVTNVRFPDFILYRQVRGLYEDYIAAQRNHAVSSLREKAESRMDAIARFDELEKYGELLTKYPILLEYMAQEKKQAAE
ncbi:MAG TPA: hypothetical protein DEQ14_03240 [Treponema sp.]|nr:hypothetical protein [Treponema sp.]